MAGALMLAGCGSLIPGGSSGGAAPGTPSQTARAPARPGVPVASVRQSQVPRPEDASCLADLGASGARFDPLPDTYAAPGCNKLGTVQLMALAGDRAPLTLANMGPVRCGVAKAFGDWARFGVDRAARQLLGSPVARIETMGSAPACTAAPGRAPFTGRARNETKARSTALSRRTMVARPSRGARGLKLTEDAIKDVSQGSRALHGARAD